jgi:3-hydroxybutyrate dehydrogenase
MLFGGKSAVVAGSTSGIGLGTPRAPAEAGADVVLNGFETFRSGLARAFGVRV